MELSLERDKIVLDRLIGKENTQALFEGDIIVPDIKPDMSVILSTDASVSIDRAEATNDRINYMGKLNISVLYLAKGAKKSVHSMNVTHSIDDFINIEGVTKDTNIDISSVIANIDYKMLNDRKINFRAVADIQITAVNTEEHGIITGISGEGINENQLLKIPLGINRSIASKNEHIIIKNEITISAGKPNIRELLQCNIGIGSRDVRITNGKVQINGEITVTTLYKGDEDESLIEFIENEIPFNGTIEMPEITEDMYADVKLIISDQYVQVRPDDDGEDRSLELEVSMLASVKVGTTENINVLEDAYCINKNLVINREPVQYSRLICRNKNQTTIKEVIQLDDGLPDMLQIFNVKGTAQLDDVKIIDDKVVCEGIIDCDVLYVAESDETPLYSYKCMIPYRQVIETKGATGECNVQVEPAIEHSGFNMLSGKEVELRFLLSFSTVVTEENEAGMICAIDFSDMEKSQIDAMPSMIIYVVQNSDNLWKIAKRYNTTIDEIMEVNDMESSDIHPGQKILVVKKIYD